MRRVHSRAGALGWPMDTTRCVSVLLLLLLCSCETKALQAAHIRQRRTFFKNIWVTALINLEQMRIMFLPYLCNFAFWHWVTMMEHLQSVLQKWMIEWWNKIIIFSYECLIRKGRKKAAYKSLCVMHSCGFLRFLMSSLKNNVAYKFLFLKVIKSLLFIWLTYLWV